MRLVQLVSTGLAATAGLVVVLGFAGTGRRWPAAALALDLVLAAGLIRLAATESWDIVAAVAFIVAVRVLVTGVRAGSGRHGELEPDALP